MLGSYTRTYLAMPTLFLVLLAVCNVRNATCLGSDRAPDSNSPEVAVDGGSGVVPVEESPQDQNEDNSTQSGQAYSAQDTSTDDPNTTAGTKPRTPFWLTNKMIAFYVVMGTAVIALTGWFFLVRSQVVRTRLKKKATMLNDPELTREENGKTVAEFLIVFNWTQKILYLPTVIASLFDALITYLLEPESALWFFSEMERGQVNQISEVIGGIWFALFFLNFLVEEYNIRFMVIVTSVVSVGFLLLWLYLSGWMNSFFHLFTHLDVFMSWKGYLLVALIGLLTIVISWIKGLFYYVVITPNFINVQEGLTETGTQIAKKDFYTSVDTIDLVERLLGFGKIKITFKGGERHPIVLYVWRIGAKAKKIEEIGTKMIVT